MFTASFRRVTSATCVVLLTILSSAPGARGVVQTTYSMLGVILVRSGTSSMTQPYATDFTMQSDQVALMDLPASPDIPGSWKEKSTNVFSAKFTNGFELALETDLGVPVTCKFFKFRRLYLNAGFLAGELDTKFKIQGGSQNHWTGFLGGLVQP